MARPDDGAQAAGRRGPGLIIMAACAAAALSLTVGCSSGSAAWTPERVEGVLKGSSGAELYAAIKAGYPDDYNRFLAHAVEDGREHGDYGVVVAGGDLVSVMMRRHFDGVARAPDAQLVEIARQHVELLRLLRRENALVCAQFLAHGNLRESTSVPQAGAMETRINALIIRAASAGEHDGVTRAALTPEERAALLSAAARHAPDAAPLLTHPGNIEEAPSEQQCAAGAAVYETVATMPPEMAAKAIISLLRPPAEPTGAPRT